MSLCSPAPQAVTRLTNQDQDDDDDDDEDTYIRKRREQRSEVKCVTHI